MKILKGSGSEPPEQQGEQALCLSIVVNAIVAWNTVYTQRVLDELRAAGELITTARSSTSHRSPTSTSIGLCGPQPPSLTQRLRPRTASNA